MVSVDWRAKDEAWPRLGGGGKGCMVVEGGGRARRRGGIKTVRIRTNELQNEYVSVAMVENIKKMKKKK